MFSLFCNGDGWGIVEWIGVGLKEELASDKITSKFLRGFYEAETGSLIKGAVTTPDLSRGTYDYSFGIVEYEFECSNFSTDLVFSSLIASITYF